MKSTNNADTNFQLIIRSAEFADTREISAILASSFYQLPQFIDWLYPFIRFTIGEDLRYRMRLATPNYCCLVALADNHEGLTLAGTVEISLRSTSWWTDSDRFPYISNLAVKRDYRRQKIASKLLARCEQIAKDWGYEEMFLHVMESNYSAKQLYDRNEYQIIQVKPSWENLLPYNSPRLLLKKTIQSR